jgi:hypothetical protein
MTPMATCRRNCNAPNDLCLSMEIPRALPRTNLRTREVHIAYSGRFFIDEDKNVLIHEMAVSFFPNRFGSGTCGWRRSIANAFSMVSW